MTDLLGTLLYLFLRILQFLLQLIKAWLIAMQLLKRWSHAGDFVAGASQFDFGIRGQIGNVETFFQENARILFFRQC